MARIFEPRVRETSDTEGVGDIVLSGEMLGSLAFADVMSTGDTCDIVMSYLDTFEECEVTFNASGNLVRGAVYRSKHANGTVDQNHVSFAAGTKTVIMTVAAFRAVTLFGALRYDVAQSLTEGESTQVQANLALNISTAEIVDLAVTQGKINDLAVSTGKIADLAVTAGKIGSDAIETAKIKDLNVTTGKLANGAVTGAKLAAGVLVNRAYYEYTTAASLPGNTPFDSTIPLITEGNSIFSESYTPQSAANRLEIQFVGNVSNTTILHALAHLHINGASNAAAVWAQLTDTDDLVEISGIYEFAPGSVSPQALNLRIGCGAGNTYVNQRTDGTTAGANMLRWTMTIKEYKL